MDKINAYLREAERIKEMFAKNDYVLTAFNKHNQSVLPTNSIQNILESQNLTTISSMQKMLEPFGMQETLKNLVISPDFSRINEMQKLVELSKFDAVARMEKISGISVSSLSGLNKFQEILELKNVVDSEKIEKMFDIPNIKSMWDVTLEANKSNNFDDVIRIENNLFNSSAMRIMREISTLTSFKALNCLENLPFEYLAKNFVFNEKLSIAFDAGYLDADLFEMDAEIAEELSNTTDFFELSDSAKETLAYIYHFYLLPILLSYMVAVCTGSNPNVIENLSKLFVTHQQVESINEPLENNSPNNKHREQPNQETINAMEAAERGEYETVSLDDLRQQWNEA